MTNYEVVGWNLSSFAAAVAQLKSFLDTASVGMSDSCLEVHFKTIEAVEAVNAVLKSDRRSDFRGRVLAFSISSGSLNPLS